MRLKVRVVELLYNNCCIIIQSTAFVCMAIKVIIKICVAPYIMQTDTLTL